MNGVLTFFWETDPELFRIGPFAIRWYGLLFGLAFFVGFYVIRWIFRQEQKPERDLDRLVTFTIAGAVLGARLGHCLFYEPAYYLSQPLEILKVWRGGLASHGGAAGLFFGLYLYVRNRPNLSYLWILDRVAIPTALGACFIRIGNFFNSEILGTPTDLPWGFVFGRVDSLSRHPAQLYESIGYGLIFLLLLLIYRKQSREAPQGLFLGLFLVSVFTFRFFIEFVKMRQAAYGHELPLSVGQWLSLPMVGLGLWLLFRTWRAASPDARGTGWIKPQAQRKGEP